MSRVAIAFPRSPMAVGGAEAFAHGLTAAFRAAGHAADLIEIAVDESTFEGLLEGYAAFDALDLADYDVVVSTKAPSYAVRHRRHVLYLLHTVRVFYDRFEPTFPHPTARRLAEREVIHLLDRALLAPERFVARFAIGATAVERVREALPDLGAFDDEQLHCPPPLDGVARAGPGRHLLVPGRLHPWKRVDLLLRAYRRVDRDVPLLVVGEGDAAPALARLASGDPRIRFLGRVEAAELADLYAGAIAVPFVPVGEDLGLVALEAFAFAKPVLTCTDSGEPARIVRDGETGFVVPPDEAVIAGALTRWIDDPPLACTMGMRGRSSIRGLGWPRVVSRLWTAVERSRGAWRSPPRRPYRVLVADIQPIDPPVGGGRVRLRSLYGALGDEVEATYVGSFSWRGPGPRRVPLARGLVEIDVPLEDDHFARHDRIAARLPGRQTIDVSLPFLLSPEAALPREIARHAAEADVVVLSHPWLHPALRRALRERDVTLVYDAQNCETALRAELLGATPLGRALAEGVRQVEGRLCRESHAILACSEEDRARLAEVHGVAIEKIVVVPNAVDTVAIRPSTDAERRAARARLGLDGFVVLFIGSAYAPNEEAVEVIRRELAPRAPEVTFLVVGGVGDAIRGVAAASPANVRILGTVAESVRSDAYAAADLALNPVSRGSGVNVKMLDFFAAGLPVLSTEIGGRGLPKEAFAVAELDAFAGEIARLRADRSLRAALGARARRVAERDHDAGRVSAALARTLRRVRPFFTVVVPTYDRAAWLERLLGRLDRQTFRDFEVVVVDQTSPPVPDLLARRSYPGVWLHDPVCGAARARNTAARAARGRVLAFTDDDCVPDVDWLERAHAHLAGTPWVGLEGRIVCDETDRRRFRVVTNEGFEGIGYMTANLFVRRDAFERVGGFDERFDEPHFREDTDLGWRCLAHGEIPHAADVRVLHPAAPRDQKRDSLAERARFFEQDALLFAKHPERYRALLERERNHRHHPTFWREFSRGILRHRLTIDVAALEPFAGGAFPEVVEAVAASRRANESALAG